MKYFLIILFAAISFAACQNNGNGTQNAAQKATVDSANFTTVQWIDSSINFGEIEKGKTVTVVFHCKNTGNKPLIITNARPGCGCTLADYTKAPIAPNGQGEVKATFDTNKVGYIGEVHKSIFVSTNTTNGSNVTLQFTGTIKEAKK